MRWCGRGSLAFNQRRKCMVLFLTTLLPSLGAEEPAISPSEFDAQAFAAQPIEKSYAFHKALFREHLARAPGSIRQTCLTLDG